MADSIIISNLPTHTPDGSDYLAVENISVTGKATVNDIVAAAQAVQTNAQAIGTLSNLTTSSKGSLVAAINEVDSHADTNASNIATNATAITALNGKTASIEARFGSFLPTNTNIDNLGTDDGGMWLYERVAPRNHTGTFPQTDTYGWLINIPGSSANFGTQIIRSNNLAVSSGMFYIRFRVGGSWGAWMKIVATAI